LPTSEELSRSGSFRWRLDDERIDLALLVVLLAPMLAVLIYVSFPPGRPSCGDIRLARGPWPHYVAKLLSDRLSDVALLLEEKQSELKDLVYTIAHDLKAPVSAVLLTADSALQRDGARLPAETRRPRSDSTPCCTHRRYGPTCWVFSYRLGT
jgi:signal transduction histidine kinase